MGVSRRSPASRRLLAAITVVAAFAVVGCSGSAVPDSATTTTAGEKSARGASAAPAASVASGCATPPPLEQAMAEAGKEVGPDADVTRDDVLIRLGRLIASKSCLDPCALFDDANITGAYPGVALPSGTPKLSFWPSLPSGIICSWEPPGALSPGLGWASAVVMPRSTFEAALRQQSGGYAPIPGEPGVYTRDYDLGSGAEEFKVVTFVDGDLAYRVASCGAGTVLPPGDQFTASTCVAARERLVRAARANAAAGRVRR